MLDCVVSLRPNSTTSLRTQFLRVITILSIPLLFLLIGSNTAVYFGARRIVRGQIEALSTTFQKAVEIQMDSSIRAYLKSKTEVALELIFSSLDSAERPSLEETERLLLSLSVGSTGYFYIINSDGVVLIHPDPALVGVNLYGRTPAKEQIEMKSGYLEYYWQNTDETELHPKALWMEYIPELDWIVAATTYRSEFTSLVDIPSLQELILEGNVSASGYSFIFDREGLAIAHPTIPYSEGNLDSLDQVEYRSILDRFFLQKEGFISYKWESRNGKRQVAKQAFLHYLPDYDWVVGTTVEAREMNRPGLIFLLVNLAVAAVIFSILMLFLGKMNQSMREKISHLSDVLNAGHSGDLSVRISVDGPAEMVEVSEHINYFIESLQEKTRELRDFNDSLEETVLERTEELTNASVKLLESEKLALSSRLVAELAHELSSPIGLATTAFSFASDEIKDLSRTLEAGTVDKNTALETLSEVSQAADIALGNLSRAGDLLRSFRSITTDQISEERRSFLLEDIIKDVITSMKPALRKKQINLQVDIPQIVLDSFPGVYIHTFINLITNTIKHGFEDRHEGSIKISALTSEGQLVLNYRDDGKGIQSDILDRVFDPFVTTGRDTGSTGLGLNIVHGLITDTLGGTIQVQSEVGKYCHFTIRVPMLPPDSS